MNILMFVMTMMMLLGVMTYAKLDSFRTVAGLEIQFENYMQLMERKAINEGAACQYDSAHFKKEAETDEPPCDESAPAKRSNATSTLPIGILLKNPADINTSEEYHYTAALLKALINNVYGNYDFFKKALEERPNAVEELLTAVPIAMQNKSKQEKITKAKDLANLDLGDPWLNQFFYKLLKGAVINYKTPKGTLIEEGYPSLLKYVNIGSNKRLRVYLAPKSLLQVLFNPAVADEIVTAREYFHKEVAGNRMDASTATEKFEGMFALKVNPIVPIKRLDFSVSKTDPRKYNY